MELSKDKRPPRSIWHNEYKINEWFEEVFERGEQHGVMDYDPNEVD